MNTGRNTAGPWTTEVWHHPSPEGNGRPGGVRPCDLVTVPARQGLEAVDILRLGDGVGPVLHDRAGDTLGFLVPPGTADRWDLPGSVCIETYRPGQPVGRSTAQAPGAALHEPPIAGTGWLVPPEGLCAQVTEPALLRAALTEAARTLAAADSCLEPGARRPRGCHSPTG